MSDPTARALTLLSLLQTHRHWSGSGLAERLGVTARTVRRDVDRLRELGYPVIATPGVDGGYQLDRGSQMPPLLVDDDEAVALCLGLRSAAGAAIEGIEETSVRVMAKLEQILPDHVRRRVDALQSNLDSLRSPPPVLVPATHLTVIAQGCRDHEELIFDYTRRDGDQQRRRVQPHQLVTVGPRWYLVAWDIRREDWRTFRVDRMEEPRLVGGRFAPKEIPASSAAEFVRHGLGSALVRHHAVVRLLAPQEEIERAQHWLGRQVERCPDDPARMTLRADELEWLASLVTMLSVSFEIEIEEAPEEVRTLLTRAADRLAASRSPAPQAEAPE